MNRPRLVCLGILSGLLTASSFVSLASAQASPAPSPATHVGVVNLIQVYTSIQETKDSAHVVNGLRQELDNKQHADQDQLKALQDKMNNQFKAGSAEREKAMEDYDKQVLQSKFDEQMLQVTIYRTQAHQMVQAYNEIKAVVADLAKKKGLDLVIVSSNTDLPDNAMDLGNAEQLQSLVFNRTVMYVSDKVDLSQEAITKLDADYKAGNNAPAPGH